MIFVAFVRAIRFICLFPLPSRVIIYGMLQRRSPSATALALLSIVIWGFLTFMAVRLTHVPSFLLAGIGLTIGGLISTPKIREWRVPLKTLLIGAGGMFGYHFLLFTALQLAPAVEVNLLNYLWPLLIVALTPALLPGYTLGAQHIVGVIAGLTGAVLVVSGGQIGLDVSHLPGYLCAAGTALIWACYSLLTKRVPAFSSFAVGGFCAVAGVAALAVYFVESALGLLPAVSLSGTDWLSLVLIGIGPLGIAFFTWDAALKRGDPRRIGALSYLTPLLSTLVLVVFNGQQMSPTLFIAMGLIVGGAVISSIQFGALTKRLRGNSALP